MRRRGVSTGCGRDDNAPAVRRCDSSGLLAVLPALLSPMTLPICSAAVHAAFRPSPGSAQHGPHQHADASTAGSF